MEVNIPDLKNVKKSEFKIAIIQLIAGILFFIVPQIGGPTLVTLIGAIAILFGVVTIVILMTSGASASMSWRAFVTPIITIAIGLFAIIKHDAAIQLIAYAFGIATIIKGIGTVFSTNLPLEKWKIVLYGAISIGLGALVIYLANDSELINKAIGYIFGGVLIFHSIVDFIINRDLGKIIDSAGSDEVVTIERTK